MKGHTIKGTTCANEAHTVVIIRRRDTDGSSWSAAVFTWKEEEAEACQPSGPLDERLQEEERGDTEKKKKSFV